MRAWMLYGVVAGWLCGAAGLLAQEPNYGASAAELAALPPLELLRKAKDFALQQAGDPAASRAGLDWYVAATALGHGEEQKAARLYLILEHPRSVPGAFVYQSLANPAEFAKILLEEFERPDRELDTPFLTRYVLATMMAPQNAQAACLENLIFLASMACACQNIGQDHRPWQETLRQRDAVGKTSKLVDLVLASDKKTADKFVLLQEHKESSVARAMQRGLFLKLRIQNRAGPREIRVHVENLLAGSKWDEALTWIDKLSDDARDPQVRFWQGWAWAATGKLAAGREALEQLAREAPESEWGEFAGRLATHLRAQDGLTRAAATTLYAQLEAWKQQPPEVMEAKFSIFDEETQALTLQGYVGLNVPQKQVEVLLQKESQTVLAYRAQGAACSFYTAGQPAIMSFAQGAAVPIPRFQINELADGKYNVQFNANLHQNVNGDLGELFKSLLSSPVLASEASIAKWVGSHHRHGMFLETQREGAERQFVWLTPQVTAPKNERLVIQFGERGLESILSKTWRVEKIRIGQTSSLTLSPPAWPDLPLRHKDQLEPQEMFAAFGAFAQLFTTPPARVAKREGK